MILMLKTDLLRAAVFAGAAILLAGCTAPEPGARPNVLLIITDDQGYGDLGAHGNPVIKTPALDKFYSESIRLTNFHVSPTCSPTRAALMTGRYTNATGAWHTIMGRSLLHVEEISMAECFRASGYRTGMFGKWHLGDNYPFRPQDRGFDEALVHGGGGIWQTPDYFGNDYADDTYRHNGRWEKYQGFCTDVWFANAMEFMRETAEEGRPFFCYLATNAPHGPMWAPEKYAALYEGVEGLKEPGFYGMITNIDDNFARLWDFLIQSGLEENTIVIFMTDNGTAAGEKVFNAGMRGKKGSPYEGGHRVPFFIRWPAGGLTGPRDIDTLAAHIDVLPTLIELCGLTRPDGPPLHGRSLRPLLYGEAEEWPDRVIVTDSQRMEHIKRWRRTAVMTQRWRLINPTIDGDPERLELYDIQADPGQERDVAAERPGVVERLKAAYEDWWELTSGRADQYARIELGGKENPARLTAHDWHGDDVVKIWSQRWIRRGPAVNGWWAVEVRRAGRYRFELRRWPKEVDLPITAPYEDKEPNREKTPGRAIDAVKARLKVGEFDETVPVGPGDKAAVFEVELPAGPAKLETWFYGASGEERGAYYVYVERL